MDDTRVWNFEESLWRASEGRYHGQVDPECVMALSHAPYLFTARPRSRPSPPRRNGMTSPFSNRHISRPQEGLIVVGYEVKAQKGDTTFTAACTSVYRQKAHEDWTVVQHAQVVQGHGDQA